MNYIARNILSAILTALFCIVALTGVLLFFKIHILAAETLHIWLGLAFVGIACIHMMKNWGAFIHYFKKKSTLYSMVTVMMLGSLFIFIPLFNPTPKGVNPKTEVFKAMTNAPLTKLAQFVQRDEGMMLQNLKDSANISATAEQSIADIAKSNNKQNNEILQIVFLEPLK